MQKIIYHRDTTKKALTWFAKISPRDTERLSRALMDIMLEITEHSTMDNAVWHAATGLDREFWGKGRKFGQWQPNNMISVLSGAIKKLREGDLTEKQVRWVNNIFTVVAELQTQQLLRTPAPIPEYQLEHAQGNSRQDKLRQQLFDHA